jgi:hypothetical protein
VASGSWPVGACRPESCGPRESIALAAQTTYDDPHEGPDLESGSTAIAFEHLARGPSADAVAAWLGVEERWEAEQRVGEIALQLLERMGFRLW